MAFWDFLTGGSKAADNVTETVKDSAKSVFSIIDESFYTDQEKGEASQKAVDTYCKIWEFTTKENTGTSVARRDLMAKLTNFVLAAAAVAIFAELIGQGDAADVIVKHVKAFYIGEAFAAGTAFYFLTHVAKGIKGGK